MTDTSISRRLFVAGSAASLALSARVGPVMAQSVDYAGETLDFVNFGTPGSPPDIWFRAFLPYVEKHLPGNPQINVINRAGAGSMIAANYTANVLPNDGLSIGSMNAVAMNKAAIGDPSANFDLNRMEIIGANKLTRLLAVKKEGINNLDDLLASDEELILGMESDATPYFEGFFALTGIPHRFITSYVRFPDTLQAFRSGEIDAMPMSVNAWVILGPDLAQEGAFPAWQYGFGEADGTVTATDTVDIPTGHSVAEAINPDGVGTPDWDLMTVHAAGQTVSEEIWAPEGTPAEYVAALSQGFADAAADPDFIAQHVEQYGVAPEWTDGEQARAIIDNILAFYGN